MAPAIGGGRRGAEMSAEASAARGGRTYGLLDSTQEPHRPQLFASAAGFLVRQQVIENNGIVFLTLQLDCCY